MKFLCVPCDTPMRLQATSAPDRGSLAVEYACPECGYAMAMLTNPFETQLVQSLGVRIGPAEAQGEAAGASRCPFSGMVAEAVQAGAGTAEAGAGAGTSAGAASAGSTAPGALHWTDEARSRLENIPAFVRPMATMGIERLARERGRTEVDAAMLDEARALFGM